MAKVTVVEETDLGLYLWEMPDGSIVCDEEKNYLNIPSRRGDKAKMKILRDTVRSFGIEEGKPVFLSGHRRVTDEEYEYQKQRLKWGLIPDEKDFGAAREEIMNYKKGLKG